VFQFRVQKNLELKNHLQMYLHLTTFKGTRTLRSKTPFLPLNQTLELESDFYHEIHDFNLNN
jgi:hypothetical protein